MCILYQTVYNLSDLGEMKITLKTILGVMVCYCTRTHQKARSVFNHSDKIGFVFPKITLPFSAICVTWYFD